MSQRNYLGVQDYPIPIGTIIPVVGIYSQYNDGFLICNGIAVNRTTWSKLFAVIGTQFGAGDGSTTFNIPNLVGSIPKGSTANSGGGAGSLAGTLNYTLAETNMPSLGIGFSGASFSTSLQRSCFIKNLNTETPYQGTDATGWLASSADEVTAVNVTCDSLNLSYTGTATPQSVPLSGSYVAPSYQMIYLIKGQESFGHQQVNQ
jgi:microcystin-dependent protein